VNLDPECVAAMVLLVPAAAGQVRCAERLRRARAQDAARTAAMRRMRRANRLTAAVLLVNLMLGTVATILWADASIGGSPSSASPPLLWPLLLFAAGIAVSIVANARARWSAPPRPQQAGSPPAQPQQEHPQPALPQRPEPGPLPSAAAGPDGRERAARVRPVRRAAR
jgi:hypothetical protein